VNRLSILSATMMLGVALVPNSILAQQQPTTLRQQTVGVWSVISNTLPQLIPVIGTTPRGFLFYAGSGKFAIVLKNSDRPKGSARGDGMFASFGTWTVDEASKTMTARTEGSMNSSIEGNDRKTSMVFSGGERKVTGPEGTTNLYRQVAALPQGSTFRQGLLGAWELVSASPAGTAGTNAKGYLMLGGSGRYVTVAKNPDRPKSDKPSADGFAAQFGTWSIDEGAKTLSRRVVGALNQGIEGTEFKSTYSMNGDEMKLTSADGKTTAVYRHLAAIQ
jgi:hypothetical protein